MARVSDGAAAARPTVDDVMGVLRGVIDPELGTDIVDLGMARSAVVNPDGLVEVTVALTTSGCPLRAQIQRDVRSRVGGLPGVEKVKIHWSELTQDEKAAAMARARLNVSQNAPDTAVPPTAKVVMVASGKGGVGKSTITVNLAAELARRGMRVGVMDADIWGYSVPRMLGVEGRLSGAEDEKKIAPNEKRVGDGVLEVVSMGFLVDREETALMWRGLILNRAVQHFLEDVRWGPVDYLLIDMPPGTGDVQMGIAKMLPQAEMVVVTTPARSAQKVATRVASMGRSNYLRIAGVIENMSAFVAPDGERYEIFGQGGGQELANELGVPLLGQVPIDGSVATGGEDGPRCARGSPRCSRRRIAGSGRPPAGRGPSGRHGQLHGANFRGRRTGIGRPRHRLFVGFHRAGMAGSLVHRGTAGRAVCDRGDCQKHRHAGDHRAVDSGKRGRRVDGKGSGIGRAVAGPEQAGRGRNARPGVGGRGFGAAGRGAHAHARICDRRSRLVVAVPALPDGDPPDHHSPLPPPSHLLRPRRQRSGHDSRHRSGQRRLAGYR